MFALTGNASKEAKPKSHFEDQLAKFVCMFKDVNRGPHDFECEGILWSPEWDLKPGERHSRETRDDGMVTLCTLRTATVLSRNCRPDFACPLAKQVMSHSRDSPGVTAPLRTNIVPLTRMWNLNNDTVTFRFHTAESQCLQQIGRFQGRTTDNGMKNQKSKTQIAKTYIEPMQPESGTIQP